MESCYVTPYYISFPSGLLKLTLRSNCIPFSSKLGNEKFLPLSALSQTSLARRPRLCSLHLRGYLKKELLSSGRSAGGLRSLCLPCHINKQPWWFALPAPSQPGLATTSLARGISWSAKSWLNPIPVRSVEDYAKRFPI